MYIVVDEVYLLVSELAFGGVPSNTGSDDSWSYPFMIDSNNASYGIYTSYFLALDGVNNFAIDNEIDPHDIGTTLECVVVDGTYVYIVHIGDSRVYLLGKDGLKQITKDHTAIAEMVNAGILDPEEIYNHPQRNILTQALGGNLLSEIEVSKFKVSIGERILVCSDGLWGMVRDPALERILLWASPPHILVDELIVAANQAGGQDNISVVVCDILPG